MGLTKDIKLIRETLDRTPHILRPGQPKRGGVHQCSEYEIVQLIKDGAYVCIHRDVVLEMLEKLEI